MIREGKFQLRSAKVFLHYDQRNQGIHLDVRVPSNAIRLNRKQEGEWKTKPNRSKAYIDFVLILNGGN